MSLEYKTKSPKQLRSREGRSKTLYNLEKWNTSVLLYLITRLNWLKSKEIIL